MTTNYAIGAARNYRAGRTTRTVVFCEPHEAYYCVSTTDAGETMAFPCKPHGEVIEWADVFEVRGVSHDEAVRRFMGQDPAVVLERLRSNW